MDHLSKQLHSVGIISEELFLEFPNAIPDHADRRILSADDVDIAFECVVDGKSCGTKAYFPNGRLKYEYPCRQGKPHGLWRDYGKNGQLLSQRHYVRGEIQGLVLRWDENGALAFAGETLRGEENGYTCWKGIP